MLSAKSPHCLNHRGLELGGMLLGQFLGHLFYRLTGEAFSSSTISVPGYLQNVYFFSREVRTDLSLNF